LYIKGISGAIAMAIPVIAIPGAGSSMTNHILLFVLESSQKLIFIPRRGFQPDPRTPCLSSEPHFNLGFRWEYFAMALVRSSSAGFILLRVPLEKYVLVIAPIDFKLQPQFGEVATNPSASLDNLIFPSGVKSYLFYRCDWTEYDLLWKRSVVDNTVQSLLFKKVIPN
jgi:hypothetical protein